MHARQLGTQPSTTQMYVRGPKIQPNSTFVLPGSNADFAPTWLGLAGIANADMDGASIVPHLLSASNDAGVAGADDGLVPPLGLRTENIARKTPWRDFHFSEYNSLGNWFADGHIIDDPISHTYRALRFTNTSRFAGSGVHLKNILYAEYTSLLDWNFENYSTPAGTQDPYSYKFYELFDLDADPWQLTNIFGHTGTSEALKQQLHELVASEFKCRGATCL